MDIEEAEELHEYIETQLQMNRLYPETLHMLHAEFKANALNRPDEREFWLKACRRANELINATQSCRKVGTAFADHELPLRRE